jgi:hypothetical protein
MKKIHILSIALISMLFLSSFGFVEYSAIQPKFNINSTDSTKSNQTRNSLIGSKTFSPEKNNDEPQKKEDAAKQNFISWTEYIAIAMKLIFLKVVNLFISIFFL